MGTTKREARCCLSFQWQGFLATKNDCRRKRAARQHQSRQFARFRESGAISHNEQGDGDAPDRRSPDAGW